MEEQPLVLRCSVCKVQKRAGIGGSGPLPSIRRSDSICRDCHRKKRREDNSVVDRVSPLLRQQIFDAADRHRVDKSFCVGDVEDLFYDKGLDLDVANLRFYGLAPRDCGLPVSRENVALVPATRPSGR